MDVLLKNKGLFTKLTVLLQFLHWWLLGLSYAWNSSSLSLTSINLSKSLTDSFSIFPSISDFYQFLSHNAYESVIMVLSWMRSNYSLSTLIFFSQDFVLAEISLCSVSFFLQVHFWHHLELHQSQFLRTYSGFGLHYILDLLEHIFKSYLCFITSWECIFSPTSLTWLPVSIISFIKVLPSFLEFYFVLFLTRSWFFPFLPHLISAKIITKSLKKTSLPLISTLSQYMI